MVHHGRRLLSLLLMAASACALDAAGDSRRSAPPPSVEPAADAGAGAGWLAPDGAPPPAPDAGPGSATLGLCAPRPAAVDVQAPAFVYYGAYGGDVASAPTLALATASGERILTLRRPDHHDRAKPIFASAAPCAGFTPEVQAWVDAGGVVAKTLSDEELAALFAAGRAADRIIEYLHAGLGYIAIDEIHAGPRAAGSEWLDGGSLSRNVVALLEELAARGYDRRVLLYMNTYNMIGQMARYGDVLRACRDHCRVLASEMYMHTANVMRERTEHCHWNLGCFERSAAELESVAPGINRRTINILGVSDVYNAPTDPRSLCETPDGLHGALYRQYARLHSGALTRQQPGVGGYTIAAAPFPGFAARQSACLARLNGWVHWPEAGGGSGPTDGPMGEGAGGEGSGTPSEPEARAPGPHTHRVLCRLFDERLADGTLSRGTGHVARFRGDDGAGTYACDAAGQCRVWVGDCVTDRHADGHQHHVRFRIHDDGGGDALPPAGLADAVVLRGSHDVCVATGAGLGCRTYLAATALESAGHGHEVRCAVFNGSDRIAEGAAITRYDFATGPPRLCVPGAGADGCGVWVECTAV